MGATRTTLLDSIAMRRLLLVPVMFLSYAAHAREPTWNTLQNEYIRAYTSAGDRDTRAVLDQLERVRGFFLQLTGPAKGQAERDQLLYMTAYVSLRQGDRATARAEAESLKKATQDADMQFEADQILSAVDAMERAESAAKASAAAAPASKPKARAKPRQHP